MLTDALQQALREADEGGFHGLLYQHVLLCPTRVWFHFHRIDCAHVNRHMQRGLQRHHQTDRGHLDRLEGLGIRPDAVDLTHHVIDEVKSSRSFEPAARLQLAFYMAVLEQALNTPFEGRLRYVALRKVITITLTEDDQENLVQATHAIQEIVARPVPPNRENKPLCRECSYRILCWGLTTEDVN